MHFEILERETVHQGFFRMLRYRVRHALFGGGMGEPITRECFERGHAAAVLPYDPVRDEVVLVEQFRVGAIEAVRGPWLLETIAGIIETGESPEAVVRREAVEEAGCELGELEPIHRYLVSPGGMHEQIHLFCAPVSTVGMGGVHGLAAEGEDIRVHVLDVDEALALMADGTIHAAMPIIALQWLALNQERLQSPWG